MPRPQSLVFPLVVGLLCRPTRAEPADTSQATTPPAEQAVEAAAPPLTVTAEVLGLQVTPL